MSRTTVLLLWCGTRAGIPENRNAHRNIYRGLFMCTNTDIGAVREFWSLSAFLDCRGCVLILFSLSQTEHGRNIDFYLFNFIVFAKYNLQWNQITTINADVCPDHHNRGCAFYRPSHGPFRVYRVFLLHFLLAVHDLYRGRSLCPDI